MSNSQKFTVIGIEPSKGEFTATEGNNKGQTVPYDYTNFHILTDSKKGIGQTSVIKKMKGSINYERYKNINLPAHAEFTFETDFTSRFPVINLVAVDFNIDV